MRKGLTRSFELNELSNIREQFPILKRKVNGQPLVYLDNAASTHKPLRVLNKINDLYSQHYSNIHRGVHTLSRESTEAFERSRKMIAAFIGAEEKEIIFTSGTTDAINLVIQGLDIPKGSEIILSTLEHHSNILPWQLWCERNGGKLRILPLDENRRIDHTKLNELLNPSTAVIALAHVSNTLGILNPIEDIIKEARAYDPRIHILIDGAQSVAHMPVNVKKLDCDYFVFSGHKMYAPTGTGVLFAKEERSKELKLSRSGGGTIKEVRFDHTEYVDAPLKFEPGTPNIEGVIGWSAALDMLNTIGMSVVFKHEHELFEFTWNALKELPEVEIYSPLQNNTGILSFNVKGAHPFDVGTLLDKYGVAVRTGHHCTQPLMQHFGIPGTVRASFAIYNTREDAEIFVSSLKKSIKMLS